MQYVSILQNFCGNRQHYVEITAGLQEFNRSGPAGPVKNGSAKMQQSFCTDDKCSTDK
jgi:hypothetical protein